MVLSPAIQSILFGVITKSVGSLFRFADDWNAPQEVRRNTILREGLLLGLTTVFTAATQGVFNQVLSPVLSRNPKLKGYELLLRAGATSIGILGAELVSRATAPKTSWDDRLELQGDDDERDDDYPAIRPAAPVTRPAVPATAKPYTFEPRRAPFTFAQVFQPVQRPLPTVAATVFRGTFSV